MQTEGIGRLKIFKDPTGNRTRNLPLVAQCLNQLCHRPILSSVSFHVSDPTVIKVTGVSVHVMEACSG
jgi:hypothetical protein